MGSRLGQLGPRTWGAYARMMERHNGVFGGCWCTYFQTMPSEKTYDADDNLSLKQRLVRKACPAALVYDGDEAVAWASTARRGGCRRSTTAGSTTRRATLPGLSRHVHLRRQEVPARQLLPVALRGALDLIEQGGGGVVQGYPHDTSADARCRCR